MKDKECVKKVDHCFRILYTNQIIFFLVKNKMASTFMIVTRQISTSASCCGKRNFRMIQLFNKRGSRAYKEARAKDPNYDIPIDSM